MSKNSAADDPENSQNQTSHTIIDRVKNRDPEAWQQFVELYSPLVYRWCQLMKLPAQDVPDLFQEVFHTVARRIVTFSHQGSNSTFRGWLRVLVRNKVIDHFRKKNKEPFPVGGTDAQIRFEQLAFDSESGSDEQQTSDEDKLIYGDLFQRALAKIRKHFSEKSWAAFWGMVVDGKSAQEIGESLGMRPGTVRVAKSRVLQRLRQELGDQV